MALRHGRLTTLGDILWAAAFGWLAARLVLSWAWRPRRLFPDLYAVCRVAVMRVGVVVPAHREPLRSLIRTLRSLASQTRPPDVVYVVVDDIRPPGYLAALLHHAAQSPIDVRLLTVAERGKRWKQAAAWHADGTCDVWALVDSDTTLAPDALEHMLTEFVDPHVHAATSVILPRNRGLLARLQEVEYATSQFGTRLLLNWIRTVPVIAGGFCAVRDLVIRDNLHLYLSGYQGVHIGDDRHLALMANLSGRVVVAHKARSYTAVPLRLGRLVRQRLRWCRGFYLGVAWTWRHATAADRLWWVMGYSAATAAASVAVLVWVARNAPAVAAVDYAWTVAGFAWIRAYRYLAEPHPKPWRQYWSWLLAPVSIAFGLVVLVPVQLWALVTCRQGAWGTR